MNIMYLSAEVEPFAKSGGLGDVLGALPKAVAKQGCNVSVVMPKYTRLIDSKYQDEMNYIGYMYVDLSWRHQYCGVFKLEKDGVNYYFLDNEFTSVAICTALQIPKDFPSFPRHVWISLAISIRRWMFFTATTGQRLLYR